jgi:hypothetical protein
MNAKLFINYRREDTRHAAGSEAEGRVCPSGQSGGVSTPDMRSDLLHRQRAGRSVTAKNVDIEWNEADWAECGVKTASAFALEFGED